MIIVVGDVHGFFGLFKEIQKKFDSDLPLTFIQVGDFGYWPQHMPSWPQDFPWPVYFIDGNHDHLITLLQYKEVTELEKNLFYVPRGTILTLDNLVFGFMGGGFSIDKHYREKSHTWFPEEDVTKEQVQAMLDKKVKLDYLVTHSPPQSVVKTHFASFNKASWHLTDQDDMDFTPLNLQYLWENLGYPYLVCGHMHRTVIGPNYTILDINDIWGIKETLF